MDLSRPLAVLGAAVAGLTLSAAVPAVASANSQAQSHANAHAYRHGVIPKRGSQPLSLGGGGGNMTYHGGTGGIGVTTGTPQVYVVYWGAQWGAATTSNGITSFSGDPKGLAPYQQKFFKGLGTNSETWSGVMTQYCQDTGSGSATCSSTSTQRVGAPTSAGVLAGVWADTASNAPSQAKQQQLANEATAAAAHFGLTSATANRNTQFVITSPTGTNPDGFNTIGSNFCAWHDHTGDPGLGVSTPYGDLAFTNMPYVTDAGTSCGQNFVNAGSAGTLDGVSIVGGHEYAETITDQSPNGDALGNITTGGWADSQSSENGDKCAWISSGQGASSNLALATGTFAVQSTWANDFNNGAGGCELSHPIMTDGSGGGGGTETVTVTNPGNQTSFVGKAVSLQLSGSDSAGNPLTWSATNLPAGLSINASTGLITGTPTTVQTVTVTVTAKSSTNATGSTSFTWTVKKKGGH